MKGLRKYIAPFAPDQSGAAAVFCELGGLVVILDAGGCAGNICGFDEPRWFGSRSAIFSAGLRDMDAILGRDDRLVEKTGKACKKIDGNFIAVIGTPVPAVIGTDYRALSRMIEKKTGLPVITVDTDGTSLYDQGEEKAFAALFEKFAHEKLASVEKTELSGKTGRPDTPESMPEAHAGKEGTLGVIGMTPLAFGGSTDAGLMKKYFQEKGFSGVYCYGMGDGIDAVKKAAFVKKNIVVSPSGLKAAKYLEKEFGTPYELFCPPEIIPEWQERRDQISELSGKKILIVHQQVLAKSLRTEILAKVDAGTTDITAATWFMAKKEANRADLQKSTDSGAGSGRDSGVLKIKEEDDWISLVKEGGFDVIIADGILRRAVPDYAGQWWELPHFAVSGKR